MPISDQTTGRPSADTPEPGPGRPVLPDGTEPDFGEKGPEVEDDQAGLSEAEKLDEAVEELSEEKGG